jgi:hypothetical protein
MNTLRGIEFTVAIRLLLNQFQLQDAIEGQVVQSNCTTLRGGPRQA